MARTLDLWDGCGYRADGQPDAMHIGFSKSWLWKSPNGPRLTKDQAMDPRLIFPGCRKHHHQLDYGSLTLHRHQIPASVEEFAAEHGLEYKLEMSYPPQTVKEPDDPMGSDRPRNSTSRTKHSASHEDALRGTGRRDSPDVGLSKRGA